MTSIAASLMEIPRPLVLQRILITDHDPATQARLQHFLSAEGYGVEIVTSWTECRERLRATPISVLVDGRELVARVRAAIRRSQPLYCQRVPLR